MMFYCCLEILKVKLKIISEDFDLSYFFENSAVPGVFLPEYKFIKSEDKFDLIFEIIKSSKKEIKVIGKSIYIYDTWNNEVPTYFLRLIYSFLNSYLLKKGIYSIHSSCVSDNDKVIILAGFAKDGKTTLALKFINNSDRYKLVANNKTFLKLGKNCIVLSGTRSLSIRDKETEIRKGLSVTKQDSRYGRKFILFDNSHLDSHTECKKVYLFSIRVNNGVEIFQKMSKEESLIYLYPRVMDLVDFDTLMFDFNCPTNIEFPTFKERVKIVKNLNQFIKNNEIYYISGSFDFIYDKIIELTK